MAKESLPKFSFNSKKNSLRLAQFWGNIAIRTDPNVCWEWQAHTDRRGYGRFSVNGKQCRSHRIAWALSAGRWPKDGFVICHSCDNPPCCNPAHLREDTQQGNMQEMVAKGRMGQKQACANSPTSRQFCKNGHPWTAARLRRQSQYTGTISYVCKDCNRERMMRRRNEKSSRQVGGCGSATHREGSIVKDRVMTSQSVCE